LYYRVQKVIVALTGSGGFFYFKYIGKSRVDKRKRQKAEKGE